MTRRPLALALLAALCAPAIAQQSPPEEESTDAASLDTVVVTGTRSRDRTVAESLAPIDVLGPEDLQNAGTPELSSVLAREVPSFNFPRTSITDQSDHVRPAQLRGLSPDQTLVLINGKRRHRTATINVNGTVGRGSSPVDLNAIPISAIRSVEILRDGAAAQYGSDAIAGVINIRLKDADEGGMADARFGETAEGDGDLFQASVNTGLNVGAGFINLTAEYRDKDFTNRAGPDRRQQYPLLNGGRDPRENAFDPISHRFGDAATVDRSIFYNAEHPFNDSVSFYAFGGWSARDGEAAGFYRRAFDARNVPAIYPDGFLPLIVTDISDTSVVAGLRGSLESGWAWDFSFNRGAEEFDYYVENSLNTSLGAASPTEFYAGTLDHRQGAFNFDISNALDVGFLSNPLSMAFGLEAREEGFVLAAGEPASFIGGAPGVAPGSQVFPGFRPSDEADAERDSWAVYADFEADVTERLALGLAGRYEDYSDFGSTTSGKLSARFAFTPEWAIRGTLSNGFRAPNLQQQYYSTTATNFINVSGTLQPFEIRTFPVNSPIAIALGAEPLQAEESQNISLGLVAQPWDNFHFTFDIYRIDIDDRIVLSENITGTAIANFLITQGFPGVTGGRYFTNAIDTRTDGFDLVGRWTHDFDAAGNIGLTFGYNNNDTDIKRVAPNPAALAAIAPNLVRFGRVENGRLTVGSPKDKWILGGDWKLGAFSANLLATRYGEWQVLAANPAFDDQFGPDWVLDVSLAYALDRWTFTLGAENVTDEYPDGISTVLVTDANGFVNSGVGDNSNAGILPYPRDSAPYGFNGRFMYGRIAYRW